MQVSLHKLQIAREINRGHDSVIAKFCYGDTDDMLCCAWYKNPDIRKIQVAWDWVDIERASAVSIAIGMAIEWLSEQQ